MASLRDNGTTLKTWLTVSSITDLLDSFTIGTTEYPCIFVIDVVPEQYQDSTLLQIYRVSTIGSSDIQPVTYTVNCRSTTDYKADEIAQAVYDEINRKLSDDKMAKCSVQKCIYEDVNHYNTPIDIIMLNKL